MQIDLYKGDCLEVMDKLIADGVVVDAIITDPPYKVISEERPSGILSKADGKIFKYSNLKEYVPSIEEGDDGFLIFEFKGQHQKNYR